MQRNNDSSQFVKHRICIFCERWESGGIESFLTNMLTHMKLDGFEIDIVAAELAENVFEFKLKELGVQFIKLSGNQKNILKNSKLLRSLMAERHYDLIHVNIYHALSMRYLKLAMKQNIPVRIVHSHNTALRMSFFRPLKMLIHNLARQRYTKYATHYWACSKAAAEFMFPSGINYTFVPNGIEIQRFTYDVQARKRIRVALGVDENCLVIGHIGRLCYQKNQMFLLDILYEAKSLKQGVKLLLAGEGEDKIKLIERAKVLQLQDDVIFYGTTDRPEELYSAMDVFVFPSLFEGLGIAAVEAQASGLPVVCSESVPTEAKVSENVRTIQLSAGAKEWASAIVKYDVRLIERSKVSKKIMTYDVDSAIIMIAALISAI